MNLITNTDEPNDKVTSECASIKSAELESLTVSLALFSKFKQTEGYKLVHLLRLISVHHLTSVMQHLASHDTR